MPLIDAIVRAPRPSAAPRLGRATNANVLGMVVAAGSYDSAAIILLSDGRRTTGVDALQAAKMAADRGVRIHVAGLGTPDRHLAGAGEGMAIYLQLDEPTVREVARMTGGECHHAGTAENLRSVYRTLGSRLQIQTRETELAGCEFVATPEFTVADILMAHVLLSGIKGSLGFAITRRLRARSGSPRAAAHGIVKTQRQAPKRCPE